jgi:hypothetical protein
MFSYLFLFSLKITAKADLQQEKNFHGDSVNSQKQCLIGLQGLS